MPTQFHQVKKHKQTFFFKDIPDLIENARVIAIDNNDQQIYETVHTLYEPLYQCNQKAERYTTLWGNCDLSSETVLLRIFIYCFFNNNVHKVVYKAK